MASPKMQLFFLTSASTGAPLPGVVPVFTSYTDETGASITPPAITEVGGGVYKFTPVFPTDKIVVFVIDGTSATAGRYQYGYLRPEDFYEDYILDLYQHSFGKWIIQTTGPDANRLVLYKEDGTTVLKKFDLFDSSGAPTAVNPFSRDPV